jgi:hypothetical protein
MNERCEEWCFDPSEKFPLMFQCNQPAHYKIEQMQDGKYVAEWFCSTHFDKRMEYATKKIEVLAKGESA